MLAHVVMACGHSLRVPVSTCGSDLVILLDGLATDCPACFRRDNHARVLVLTPIPEMP